MMNQAKAQEQIYMDNVNDFRAKQLAETGAKRWKQLSPNTTKDYISAYRKLRNTLGDDIISCCHDFDDNTTKLIAKGFTNSRIRNMYNAYINLMYANNIPTETTSKYQTYLKNHQESYMKSQETNELTSPSQIENMITYAELVDYISKLKQHIRTLPYSSRLPYEQVLCILEISRITPHRINEFAHMKYIKNSVYTKLKAAEKNQKNWLVRKRNGDMFFHFRQYETTKQRPSKIQKIDIGFANRIRKLIHANIHLDESFGDTASQGDQLSQFFLDDGPVSLFRNQTPEQLSKLMIKVSGETIGKNVGSTILRKVIVSTKYQSLKHETAAQEAFAKSIGHSLAVENLIYNKNIGE